MVKYAVFSTVHLTYDIRSTQETQEVLYACPALKLCLICCMVEMLP